MGRRQDTQPTDSGYGRPSRGGLSVGAIQAASPPGFWWLDPATFTILKYRFTLAGIGRRAPIRLMAG